MSIDVMKQALEAMERNEHFRPGVNLNKAAMTALRTAIEQTERAEPVAWADMDVRGEDKGLSWTPGHFHTQPLYTTPPAAPVQERNFCERCGKRLGDGHIHTCTPPAAQRQWVGLTDEEIKPLCDENHIIYGAYTVDFIQSIEARLKEKNHG